MSDAKVVAPRKFHIRRIVAGVLVLSAVAVALLLADEVRTSRQQAEWLSARTRDLHYQLGPGPSDAIRFAGNGPYDQRLGYHQLPQLIDRLKEQEAKAGFQEKPKTAEKFFREGRAGQWRELLSRNQIRRIMADHGEQMARFGYLQEAEAFLAGGRTAAPAGAAKLGR